MRNNIFFIFHYIVRMSHAYRFLLRLAVLGLAGAAAVSIFCMISATCADIVLRAFGRSFHGAYDVVRIAGALTIACSLPYTSAVKGHVAIEYFFLKLNKPGRVAVDTACRILIMGLFALAGWRFVLYGNALKSSSSVSLTLQVPLYWLAYVIAVSCFVTMLVTLHNLLHPGREMIKP